MITNLPAWSIAFSKEGRRGEPIPLGPGTTTLGRDEANTIFAARCLGFACSCRAGAGCGWIGDSGFKKQERHSGEWRARQHALLQKGDLVEIGIYRFEITLSSSAAVPRTKPSVTVAPSGAVSVDQTAVQRVQLPDPKQDRHLSTLYHVCCWIIEDVASPEKLPRLLDLLLEGFRASEVQLYNAALELQCSAVADSKHRAIKLAPFLATRCQSAAEAMIFRGRDMGRHQQRAGQFNYLVGPLAPVGSTAKEHPFLLILRPTEWEDFTNEDRVLLQRFVIDQLPRSAILRCK